MDKLLFVTLVVTIVTFVTLSCHPDVTVFCSSFFPPPPISWEQRFLSCRRCACLRFFSFSSIEKGESRKTKQTEETQPLPFFRRCVPPSIDRPVSPLFIFLLIHFSQHRPIAAFCLQSLPTSLLSLYLPPLFSSRRETQRSRVRYVLCSFFLAENSVAHAYCSFC